MQHHILVKWNEQVTDKQAIYAQVRALFATARSVAGVESVSVRPNVIDRPNRYDLMIVLTLPAQALTTWDASALHHRWKQEYSPLIAAKAIFDCE